MSTDKKSSKHRMYGCFVARVDLKLTTVCEFDASAALLGWTFVLVNCMLLSPGALQTD